MLEYVHRPISDRSDFTGEHKGSPFDSTFHQTLRLLEDELWYLEGRDLVIEIDVSPADLRLDGRQRANSHALSPGCRIIFESMHGQLSYATDRFVRNYRGPREDWQHNLRAIALGLEASRKLDRYGIGSTGKQYTGYAALPAGTGGIALGGMTKDKARSLIEHWAGMGDFEPEESAQGSQGFYKRARRNAHPDRNDGDQTGWDEVEQAARVLGLAS